MFSIKINSVVVDCDSPKLLSLAIIEAGVFLPMNCGGNHTCGKCKIAVTKGAQNLSAINEQEKAFLSEEEINGNVRLACFVTANGACDVKTDIDSSSYSITTEFVSKNDESEGEEDYVIAVDIGTTTVVSYLYSAKAKALLSTVGEINSQVSCGADVISRIDYTNHDGESKLHLLILSQLDRMLALNIKNSSLPIKPLEVSRIVITGNTTMLHFLMNYPASGIAVSPFTPHSLFDEQHLADRLFKDFINATIYIPPCIGSYVGADTVCAVLASGMCDDRDNGTVNLLVDIGTNGEMALWRGSRLYTCSTAAGPAFEGAGIKMGMTAKAGAISDVFLKDGKVSFSVIGNGEATGICGTGLINAIAVFLGLGLIDFSGSISDEESEQAYLIGCDDKCESYIKIGDSGVILTGRDIRQVQLAKAAIHAGILTLCHECGISVDEVDGFFLCGGFGSVINPRAASDIGIIPECLAKKASPLGNGAGLGALMIARSESNLEGARNIAKTAEEIPLSASQYFMEQYVEQMMFGNDV